MFEQKVALLNYRKKEKKFLLIKNFKKSFSNLNKHLIANLKILTV